MGNIRGFGIGVAKLETGWALTLLLWSVAVGWTMVREPVVVEPVEQPVEQPKPKRKYRTFKMREAETRGRAMQAAYARDYSIWRRRQDDIERWMHDMTPHDMALRLLSVHGTYVRSEWRSDMLLALGRKLEEMWGENFWSHNSPSYDQYLWFTKELLGATRERGFERPNNPIYMMMARVKVELAKGREAPRRSDYI
tara:strand:- start:126 stop:713 length:588 start_codon:yes stop_codon:yes gene_type:complete